VLTARRARREVERDEDLKSEGGEAHSGSKMKKNRRGFPYRLPDTIEDDLGVFFSHRSEVLLVYLFGSYLKRSERSYQDIDVAVYISPEELDRLNREKPYGYEAFLISNLGRLLKSNCVDLVVLNSAPPLLQREVVFKGKLIFSRSEPDRIHFEINAMRRYADTAHLRKIKRLHMKSRIDKGLDGYV